MRVTNDGPQLLLRVHRGDDAAARELWSRYGRAMRAHARAVAPEGADDVVQRALCRVLDLRRDQIASVRDVPAFLAVLVRREALNWIRGESRERSRRVGAALRETTPMDRAAHDTPDAARSLSAAVDALPRRWREVVVLKHIAGLTFDQLAAALSANRSTVASRYRDAIERLRAQLGPHRHAENPTEVNYARV